MPVIKWSGSKKSQANEIIAYFPEKIKTYYEPFVGGGSILNALMQSDVKVNRYICSDINNDLINLYKAIMLRPEEVADHYEMLWRELNKDDNLSRKKEYFEEVRKRLNQEHNPLDFMFIMRTTVNGMPRYNGKGEFNNAFHITRNGIIPFKLRAIINDWSYRLNKNKVEFHSCTYEDIKPQSSEDFVYLDPPYAKTKGMYYGAINYDALYEYLRALPCKYALSFDGKVCDDMKDKVTDYINEVPNDVYTKHIYLFSGNSGFRRVIGKSNRSKVYESLYMNYEEVVLCR
jgi:DNA adenine methylase